MVSEALYFRASADLREGADAYRRANSLTLSSALAELVSRGLEAVGNEQSVKELEAETAALKQRAADLELKLAKERAESGIMRQRDQMWSAFVNGLDAQLRSVTVGSCPACNNPVTTFDQIRTAHCPSCNRPLLAINRSSDNTPALAALVAGIGGLVLGLAAGQK